MASGDYHVDGYLEYGACNDENCLPPTQVPFKIGGKDSNAVVKGEQQVETSSVIGRADGITAIQVADQPDYWQPVIDDLKAFGETTSQEDMSWLYIFITGFVGGLLALFTPCVWPIIPMTVSFFLKRSKDKKREYVMRGRMALLL